MPFGDQGCCQATIGKVVARAHIVPLDPNNNPIAQVCGE